MNRQNKKESVANLHRENILSVAEQLFVEKGVKATTIDDISELSNYSRRTIYSYYESKEDILYHIIFKGLTKLKENLKIIIEGEEEFIKKFFSICNAMADYQYNYPQSADSVNGMKTKNLNKHNPPSIMVQIFIIGNEINDLIANYLEFGRQHKIIRKEIDCIKSVYILWANITSLLSLAANKGSFLEQQFNISIEEFLHYGYTQIINSILEERI